MYIIFTVVEVLYIHTESIVLLLKFLIITIHYIHTKI